MKKNKIIEFTEKQLKIIERLDKLYSRKSKVFEFQNKKLVKPTDTIEDIIKTAITAVSYTGVPSTIFTDSKEMQTNGYDGYRSKFFYRTRAQSRSASDILKLVRVYKPEAKLLDVMTCLKKWKNDGYLYSIFCAQHKKNMFRYHKNDYNQSDYKKRDSNYFKTKIL